MFGQLCPDCLKAKLFTSLPLFIAFYDQQDKLGAYSSREAEAPPQDPYSKSEFRFHMCCQI